MMSTRSIIKTIYIAGMGILGEKVAERFVIFTKDPISHLLVRSAGAVTGAYAGVLIANDLDEMLSNAIDILEKEKTVEVNNG